jgi:hypothetical protein
MNSNGIQSEPIVNPEAVSLSARPASRMWWPQVIAFTLLIALVLYGDGLAILSEFPILSQNSPIEYVQTNGSSGIAIGKVRFTLPTLLFVFFNGGGVFNSVPDNNIEYAIYGRRVGADPKLPWEDLHCVKQCLPYDCRGEVYVRMLMSWHQLLGEGASEKAMSDLLIKIKKRYNIDHPYEPVDKVALYLVWWPRSEDDFYKLKSPEKTGFRLLAQE